jgi:hypothetical protein
MALMTFYAYMFMRKYEKTLKDQKKAMDEADGVNVIFKPTYRPLTNVDL